MIIKQFISHQIKESMRSSFWQKQIALNIIMGIFLLIMLAYLVMLGLFIDVIFREAFPDQDPILLINKIILYYFGIELMIRFFMQSLPILNLETYLALPVPKSSIVHYVASKSIINIGNYLSWLVFIPFAFKVIAPAYTTGVACLWALAMILLVFSCNFLATYIKRQLAHKAWIVGLFALAMVGLFALDHFKIFSLSNISNALMGGILTKPLWILVPIITLIGTYALNYFFLKRRLYPDEINPKRKERTDRLGEIKYLKSIGFN